MRLNILNLGQPGINLMSPVFLTYFECDDAQKLSRNSTLLSAPIFLILFLGCKEQTRTKSASPFTVYLAQLLGQVHDGRHGNWWCLLAIDVLHEPHDVGGGKEMHADHALRPFGCRRNLRDQRSSIVLTMTLSTLLISCHSISWLYLIWFDSMIWHDLIPWFHKI